MTLLSTYYVPVTMLAVYTSSLTMILPDFINRETEVQRIRKSPKATQKLKEGKAGGPGLDEAPIR